MEDENEEFEENETDNPAEGAPTRPLGFWLRTVDAYITREFGRAFESEGVSRRDWMLLNAVAGDLKIPGLAERMARKGKRLRGLEDRGWVEETGDGTWVLTDEGRAAKERLGAIVEEFRARVAGAVSPEDFATTIASLEAIARELGWDENERMPWAGAGRGFGRRPGFGGDFRPGFGPGWGRGFAPWGQGFGPGFGPGPFGHDPRRGFGPDDGPRPGWEGHPHHHPHGHDDRGGYGHGDWHEHHGHGDWHEHRGHGGHHRDHGHGHHGHGHHEDRHDAEGAYERGFEAGFRRGQAS